DNVADGNDTVLVGQRRQHVIGYLAQFLFPPERAQVKVRVLSGGERCRLLLAKLLIHPANVLVLDEPTNDLDLETLEFLEEQLADFPGTLLLVSHDRTFLNNLVTSVLAFEAPGTVSETIGGVDDWLRQRQREKEVRETRPAAPPLVRRRAPRHRLGFNEERELAGLPERIEGLENEKAQVMASLADPDFYRTAGSDIGRVNAWLMELEEALTRLYERWQELEEIKSGGAAGAG
ncbi:MAG TPA: ATP-binding cassette domain-containing protein, partial [Candidatus Aminicenantes bacterium]|nr:ATP-binding cassette domain-containing protein [Candidatus Aminicenantes bacterium]